MQTEVDRQDNLSRRRLYEDYETTVYGIAEETDSLYRYVHEGSVRINDTDYSIFDISIEPIDPLDPCSEELDFTWSF